MPSGRRPEIVSTLRAVARTRRPCLTRASRGLGAQEGMEEDLWGRTRGRGPMPLGPAAIVVMLVATGRVSLMERRQQPSPLSQSSRLVLVGA